MLACDSSLSNEAAYQFVKGIYENLDVISTSHAMAAKINLYHAANINLEIHPVPCSTTARWALLTDLPSLFPPVPSDGGLYRRPVTHIPEITKGSEHGN